MNWNIDEFILSSYSSSPSQPVSTITITNSGVARMYDYLRDFSDIPSGLPLPFNSSSDVNGDIFNDIVNPFDDYCQQSTTVNPVCAIQTFSELQLSGQEQSKNQEILQFEASEPEAIQIKHHPRSKFRPRTIKESKEASHYIRCEDYIPSKYPAIYISKKWAKQKNIIQITLVGIDDQPHPYIIDNKERKTSSLIFKQEEPNSIYFHLTEQDYLEGEKIFLIEYIKSKQDDLITKDLIRKRQLNQSKLRFTRYYQIADGSYQQHEASTAYSCIMTEDYGDLNIEDVFPLFGPMCGNQKVCVEMKGHLPKDFETDLIINITENRINWSYQVKNIKKNGKNFTFCMPSFPNAQINRAEVNIILEYKQEIIYQTSYIYTRELDKELDKHISKKSTTSFNVGFSSSDSCSTPLIWSSTGVGCEDRGAKRLKR